MNIAIKNKIQGQAIISWSSANLRDLFAKTIAENPNLPLEDLTPIFIDKVKRSRRRDHYMETSLEYYAANTHAAFIRRARSNQPPEETSDILDQMRKDLDALITERVKIKLLEMRCPNGKKLRNCTGLECSQMGRGFGGIGAAIRPDEVVGEVLDEKQVRELYVA